MKPKNKRYDKANEIYRNLEALLFESQEFEDSEHYTDIIDGISRALTSVSKIIIDVIKEGNVKKIG